MSDGIQNEMPLLLSYRDATGDAEKWTVMFSVQATTV